MRSTFNLNGTASGVKLCYHDFFFFKWNSFGSFWLLECITLIVLLFFSMHQKPVKLPSYNSISFYLSNVGESLQSWILKDQSSKNDTKENNRLDRNVSATNRRMCERDQESINILSLRDETTRQSSPSGVIKKINNQNKINITLWFHPAEKQIFIIYSNRTAQHQL